MAANDDFLNKDQMLKIDLFVLEILKELLLHQNLGFTDIRIFVDKDILERFGCIMEDIEMRIMYNYGMGFLELLDVNENEIELINEKCREKNLDPSMFFYEKDDRIVFKKELFNSYFLEAKINAAGLKQIEELKKQLEESEGINYIFNKMKEFLEFLNKLKLILGLIITTILICLVLIFDIKLSEYIKKIPLLSSIINTEVLESFEKVNEKDEFYKEVKSKLNINNAKDKKIDFNESNLKDYNIYEFIENNNKMINSTSQINQENPSISDIKVRNISPNEKIFRLDLNNGEQKFIKVIRDQQGKLRIDIPNALLNYINRR
ncbi:MAG: hypothetical protein PHS92_00510 [Candidatus Gracilibacteria bacterium]|nr:hypothetical protein [Candidatus Gracilibacteria bacterium]